MKDIDKSLQAKAASAHSRINVPLNLANWSEIDPKYHEDLLWFHQHVLDAHMSWDDVSEAVGYDRNTVYKFLKGISEGSYDNFTRAIRAYKKLALERADIQQAEFVHNRITRLIFSTLQYTYSNRCMTRIIGHSCMGKSTAMQAWRNENNHGRSVYVDCPPLRGTKAFLRAIAACVGVNKNLPSTEMLEAIVRSFNENRILLLDNMHRAVPPSSRQDPIIFDLVQYIFDESRCSVALSATARMDGKMRHQDYMFEQISGRCGVPVYLPDTVEDEDIRGIVEQYLKPTKAVMDHALEIANSEGRIRQLVERLKLGSKIAAKSKKKMAQEHFMKAIRIRNELSKHDDVKRTTK